MVSAKSNLHNWTPPSSHQTRYKMAAFQHGVRYMESTSVSSACAFSVEQNGRLLALTVQCWMHSSFATEHIQKPHKISDHYHPLHSRGRDVE